MRKGRAKTGTEQACTICGKMLYRAAWQMVARPNPICSKACNSIHMRQRTVFAAPGFSAMRPNSANVPVHLNCKICGNVFKVAHNRLKKNPQFCSRKCFGVGSAAEKNPSWKGGISKLRDWVKASFPYKKWRIEVFQRDRFICVACLSQSRRNNPIEAHHLKPFLKYQDLAFDLDNGCTLCRNCHKQTYKLEHIYEFLLRSRILRDFTSDKRLPLDLRKIKSDLRSDAKMLAEMPSTVLLYA